MAEHADKRLTDTFIGLFAYVADLRLNCAERQPAYAEVRGRINSLLESAARDMRQHGIDPRAYDDARFAVSAWIDETVLVMPWVHRSDWQRALLQTELYGSTSAGEEFFDRLNQLQGQDNSVREVYYICLALGFTGRYCHAGEEILLEQLKKATLKQLGGDTAGLSGAAKRVLFQEAYPQRTAGATLQTRGGAWTAARISMFAVPPVIVLLAFIVYSFVLDGVADELLARVTGG